MNKGSLYYQVINVTSELLGPASERFISRQIQSHLSKEPTALTKKDLRELIDWLKLSMALLTDDAQTVQNFTNQLRALAK